MFNYPDNLKSMRHAHAQASRRRPVLGAVLLQIVDGGLAGVIFLVPFVMGGRHPLGQLILVALAVVTALAWAIRQSLCPHPSWRPTWALALICRRSDPDHCCRSSPCLNLCWSGLRREMPISCRCGAPSKLLPRPSAAGLLSLLLRATRWEALYCSFDLWTVVFCNRTTHQDNRRC